jgi:serine/threonine protein kinase
MKSSACPSTRELEDLLEDRLPPEQVTRVDQHLRECSTCLARLDSISRERERADLPGLARVETNPSGNTPQPDPLSEETEVEMPEGTHIGPCDIVREIGRGGMGVVYEARNRGSGRRVALKVLATPSLARKNAAARFANEARAMARLRHPGIVQVFDAGLWQAGPGFPTIPYTVLELVPGPSLRTILADGPVHHRAAAGLVEAIARAVHHAHEKGVIHRDLKPANILLAKSEDGWRLTEGRPGTVPGAAAGHSALEPPPAYYPKVTDFGIAKLRDDTTGLTGSRDVLGTPEYMPPELGELGSPVAASMDVYALGVILFECLTGRVPFRGASPVQTLLMAQSREAEHPSKLQSEIPRALDAIVLKCLEKSPGRRYSSAAELADKLAAFLHGEVAPPRAGRRRAAVGLLSAAVLAGSIALGLSGRKRTPPSPVPPSPDPPPAASQIVRVKGLVPPNPRPERQTLSFRQGANEYSGCSAVELRASPLQGARERNFSNLATVAVRAASADPPAFEQQVLLHFDTVFGVQPGQIPPGSEVASARLSLWMQDAGQRLVFRRILAPWEPGKTTWDNFRLLTNRDPGVQGDDIEAAKESLTAEGVGNPNSIDVTADVRRWAMGEPNLGWAISTTAVAQIGWHAASAPDIAVRPLLTIEFTVPPPGRVTAVGDVYSTRPGTALEIPLATGILRNDWSEEGMAATVLSGPTQGKLELRADGSFRYAPNPEFVGRDSFRYRASAGSSFADATVWLFVE